MVVVKYVCLLCGFSSGLVCCGDRSHDATQGHNTPTYIFAIRVCV